MAKKQDKDKDALRLQGEETLCGAELKTTSSQQTSRRPCRTRDITRVLVRNKTEQTSGALGIK